MAGPMQTIRLTPDGPTFSAMAYGTWRMLDEPVTAQDINRRLNLCADLGMTTIDTAEIYGGYRVEAALGEALALSPGLRDRLQIVTKAGIYLPGPNHSERAVAFYDASGARLIASVERSLQKLRTDRVELFLIHRPDWLTAAEDSAEGLNALVRSGKIASAGVSNYSPSQVAALNLCLDRPIATNQVEFSLLHMAPTTDGTFDQCQREGFRPMAWSPLAGGRLFGDDAAGQRLAAAAAAIGERTNGASLEALAYAWVMAHPSKPMPVVGTNRIERIESAARAASLTLERHDWFQLWTAATGHAIP